MLEVIVLTGLQGSGKSTFYTHRFAESHALVSKDRMRNNRRPERRQQQLIDEALRGGRSVVVDNTNAAVTDRATIIAIARAFQAHVVGYYFASPLEDCLARNAARPQSSRVPDVGLFATVKKLVRPSMAEGFDELWTVQTLADFHFSVTPYLENSP